MCNKPLNITFPAPSGSTPGAADTPYSYDGNSTVTCHYGFKGRLASTPRRRFAHLRIVKYANPERRLTEDALRDEIDAESPAFILFLQRISLNSERFAKPISPTWSSLSREVLIPAADRATNVNGFTYYSHGLDVLSWLEGPDDAQPPTEHLTFIPISFLLIGLAQLVQYLIAVKLNNLTPESFQALVHGAAGHSQGIISAVVLSTSTTEESFILKLYQSCSTLVCAGRKLSRCSRSSHASRRMRLKVAKAILRLCSPFQVLHVRPLTLTLRRRTPIYPPRMLSCPSDCTMVRKMPSSSGPFALCTIWSPHYERSTLLLAQIKARYPTPSEELCSRW